MEPPKRKKIAVVLIHGMGEPVPMDNIRSFVDTVWVQDTAVQWQAPAGEGAGDVWAKPERLTHSYELRRITTRWTRARAGAPGEQGPRIDFFEGYWADLAEGTKLREVYDRVWGLLLRRWDQVPKGLHPAWLLLWLLAIIVLLSGAASLLPWLSGGQKLIAAVVAVVIAVVMNRFVGPYAGDVAKYTRPDPRNIAVRKSVRDRMIQLLDDLHASKAYERIVVVGHSLGAIVAYDAISLLWATRAAAMSMAEGTAAYHALRMVEASARALADAAPEAAAQARDDYRAAQKAFRLALRDSAARSRDGAKGEDWLISDFVTLGSPLTHAGFLLARDGADLERRQVELQYPTCPPRFELVDSEQRAKIAQDGAGSAQEPIVAQGGRVFSFYKSPKLWIVHHAAPFAAVRWTNIHDPHRLVFLGDIISGPAAGVFGPGVRDISLKDLRGQAGRFSHTKYWDQPKPGESPAPLQALRAAVDLLDEA